MKRPDTRSAVFRIVCIAPHPAEGKKVADRLMGELIELYHQSF